MPTSRRARTRLLATLAAAAGAVGLHGCIHVSNGTWMVDSAPRPEGWPELTPIDVVEVKDYPVCREARVEQLDGDADALRPMFMSLFRHIQRNDVAMTAPVDMGYAVADDGAARMTSMAFLYRTTTIGTPGVDATVQVRDRAARAFASVGVRGGYSTENFARGLRRLDEWLAANAAEWVADGSPRYLGYNSPFVPWPMRYGEVQVPVRANSDTKGRSPSDPA